MGGFNRAVSSGSVPLAEAIGQTWIIAYKEATEPLEQALTQAGFTCGVLRQQDHPEYAAYASAYRCLLNHQQAWQRAAQSSQPTLIVEADFVPVRHIGQLPLPFPLQQPNVGIAWLYTCAPQLYSVSPEGFGEGYSTALVAYIVTPQGAQQLCELVDHITQRHGTQYNCFDSEIDRFLRDRQLKNYIAFRNYGEHGGIPNPEHRRNGMSGIHRADVLYGELAFMPAYAAAAPDQHLTLLRSRLHARIKGIARLLVGKFLRLKILRRSSAPKRLLGFALGRQFSLYL
ncbi:MAG: LPS biosynthesis glycosyltransferase [Synechococcales cyanobacterium M58_A2018_015]|nr:LPS biosynthesis glycosyltransferase [Synechococcales cyanobacterium M58_A2018_015]